MIPDNFNEHIIFERLEQLKERLQEKEVREKIGIEQLSYYDTAISYIEERLKATFPVLIKVQDLSALANDIQNTLNYLNTFLGNRNAGYLTNSNNSLHSAISRVKNFPLPVKGKFNFSREIARFEQIIKEKYKNLEIKNKEVQGNIEEINSILEEKQQEIDELNQLLAQKENEINNLTSNFQAELENIKTLANQEFEQEKNKFRQEFDEKMNFFNTEVAELKNNLSQSTSQIVEELKTKLEEAKKIVNIIGNIGVTGNYQKIAEKHKKQANLWRWIALSFMVLFTGLLVYSIYHITSGDFNWKVALIRILAFSALIYPAAYAARESSKHRQLETINRKYELELASISPFIETLPDEKKQDIKEKLVDKFFGNNEGLEIKENKSNDNEISIGALEKIVKSILPFIKK